MPGLPHLHGHVSYYAPRPTIYLRGDALFLKCVLSLALPYLCFPVCWVSDSEDQGGQWEEVGYLVTWVQAFPSLQQQPFHWGGNFCLHWKSGNMILFIALSFFEDNLQMLHGNLFCASVSHPKDGHNNKHGWINSLWDYEIKCKYVLEIEIQFRDIYVLVLWICP